MVFQNKNSKCISIENILSHTGMLVMAGAIILSMAETAEREGLRVMATLQPSYATVQPGSDLAGHSDEQLRRGGKEEIRHTSATYGAIMKQHGISGTV